MVNVCKGAFVGHDPAMSNALASRRRGSLNCLSRVIGSAKETAGGSGTLLSKTAKTGTVMRT